MPKRTALVRTRSIHGVVG